MLLSPSCQLQEPGLVSFAAWAQHSAVRGCSTATQPAVSPSSPWEVQSTSADVEMSRMGIHGAQLCSSFHVAILSASVNPFCVLAEELSPFVFYTASSVQ